MDSKGDNLKVKHHSTYRREYLHNCGFNFQLLYLKVLGKSALLQIWSERRCVSPTSTQIRKFSNGLRKFSLYYTVHGTIESRSLSIIKS